MMVQKGFPYQSVK